MIWRILSTTVVGSVPNPVQLVVGENLGGMAMTILGAPNVGWFAAFTACMPNSADIPSRESLLKLA